MNFLVTGGAGFIGSAVCRHLCANPAYRVTNLDKVVYPETGTTKGRMGEQSVEGKVNGDTLTWSAAIQQPMPMTLEFTATVSGDSMSGRRPIFP